MTATLRFTFAALAIAAFVACGLTLILVLGPGSASAAAVAAGGTDQALVDPGIGRWAVAAAAASVGLSTLAAGYAVAVVGGAAVGALAEKPELLGRVLILVGLAEGIAIYGVIIAILILDRAG